VTDAPIEGSEPNALYRFFSTDGALLYVGITSDLGSRVRSHRLKKSWFREVAVIRVEHFDTRAGVERTERLAVKTEQPRENVVRWVGTTPRPNHPH
jgi:predicted GIY-YIG superfamily endonuclease